MAYEIKTKTLSEIIAELEALKAQYGDIEVAAGTEDGERADINVYIDNPDHNPTLNLYY